jgi:hypothetical protein
MFSTSSSSTGWGRAWRSGTTAPGLKPVLLLPGVSWMYFRPSDERGRTSSVESAGSGSMSLSSFIVTWA